MKFFSRHNNSLSNNNSNSDLNETKFSSTPQETQKLSKEIKVKVIGQVHKSNNQNEFNTPNFEQIKEYVAYSQLNSILELIKRPDCLIFAEEIADVDREKLLEEKLGERGERTRNAFKTIEQYLTEEQKNVLWEYGAVKVAYFLNCIKEENIYPVIATKTFIEEVYEPIIKCGVETKERLLSCGNINKDFIQVLNVPKELFPTKKATSLEESEKRAKIHEKYFYLALHLLDMRNQIPKDLNSQLKKELIAIVDKVDYIMHEKREEILKNRILKESSKRENKGKSVVIIVGAGHKRNLENMFRDKLWK